MTEPSSKRLRRGASVLAAALVLGAVVLAGSLLVDGSPPEPTGTIDPDAPYFPARRHLLSEPSPALSEAVEVDLASWEVSGPTGEDAPPRWTVLVRNRDRGRTVVVADVLVVPTPATAPGVRLRQDGPATAEVAPGDEATVEVSTEIEAAPGRSPSPGPAAEEFGVHLYVVAAFADEAELPEGAPRPEDAAAFRDTWGSFALLEAFAEVPPNLLNLRPPGETPSPPADGPKD